MMITAEDFFVKINIVKKETINLGIFDRGVPVFTRNTQVRTRISRPQYDFS